MAYTQVATDSCKFIAGRCIPSPNKVAIVLHEYDGDLSSLDNEILSHANAPTNPAVAYAPHTSFHYGVEGQTVHQYVKEDDTALSHGNPATFASSWTLPTVYPGVNPDCYTVNIAVSTGQATQGINCAPGENNYPDALVDTLTALVCDIARRNNVSPDAVHIVRHNSELDDFDFASFLTDVIACVNATITSQANDYVCDALKTFPAGAPVNVIGFDSNGNCVQGIPNEGTPFRVIQALVIGANTITHNLGYSPVMVEVRDNVTGSEIAVRVTGETATTTTIDASVVVAAARITIR